MNKTILIIDDDSRNIFALSAVLKAKGFQTTSATNMVAAFAMLDNDKSVGIILMDMMMPGMDGYEAIRQLKTGGYYPSIPIISVTAQAMAGDKQKCLDAGADEYLPKPVDVDALIGLLKNYLK